MMRSAGDSATSSAWDKLLVTGVGDHTADRRDDDLRCCSQESCSTAYTGILELKQVHLSRTATGTGTCTVAREVLVLVAAVVVC